MSRLRLVLPAFVLGLIVLAPGVYSIVVAGLPQKVDLQVAKNAMRAAWLSLAWTIPATFVIAGMLAPAARGDVGPGRAIARGLVALPFAIAAVALGVLAVAIGLVAGVVPGLVALSAVAVASQVAADRRCGAAAALDASATLTARRRWTVLGVVLAIVAVEILAVLAVRLGLPPLNKKTPPADLVKAVRHAWLIAGAAAVVAPIGAIALVELRARLQRDTPPA